MDAQKKYNDGPNYVCIVVGCIVVGFLQLPAVFDCEVIFTITGMWIYVDISVNCLVEFFPLSVILIQQTTALLSVCSEK